MFPKRSRRVAHRPLAVLCGIVLLVSACGSSSGPGAASAASASETAAPSAEAAASGESPIGELLGIPFTDTDAMDEYFADLSRRAEIKIAECMLAQGFDYQVVDYSGLQGLDTAVDFESREFAEQYGFGIASNPFEESFEAFEDFSDPNQEYLQSLGQAEVEAYQTALSGELPDIDSAASTQVFEPGGCQGEAYEAVYSFGQVFDQFADEFAEMEEGMASDPRIVEATAGWGACMTTAGYRFSDEDGARADIQRRYDAIVRDPDAFASEDDMLAQAEASGDDDDGVIIFGPQTLNPEFQSQVDELAVEERSVATASWDCNGDLREIQDAVRLEYEQRFVEQNGAAIQAALN